MLQVLDAKGKYEYRSNENWVNVIYDLIEQCEQKGNTLVINDEVYKQYLKEKENGKR